MITPESELDRLRARELAAIAAFSTGKAGLQEWHDICQMLNLCEQMAKAGVGPEALEACERAQSHLIDAKVRFERIGRMGITGPGLLAFRELYEFHDLQRQSISRSEYERHIQRTSTLIKNKVAGVIEL